MNRAPYFVGDEAAAAAYRLAGLETRACSPEDAASVLDAVLAGRHASLVLLAAPHARRLGEARLHALIRNCDPPASVVRDAAGGDPLPDLAARVRAMLGVAA